MQLVWYSKLIRCYPFCFLWRVTEIAARLADVEGEILTDHAQCLARDGRLGTDPKQAPKRTSVECFST
jgi:hypothetical protein